MKKVLVVDDSALMRKLLTGLLREGGYEVNSARNGAEAVEQTLQWQPDVVTLDINMPEMDGLTALSLLMAARPTPVIMVSSLTEKGALATFEALALGAVDFIAKPGGTISLHVDAIAELLLEKVGSACKAKVGSSRVRGLRATAPVQDVLPAAKVSAGAGAAGLVLIGVSTGGPRTLEDILPKLPANFPWPVLVAQHMPANFTQTFARRMDNMCPLEVVEVTTTMPLDPGRVYIGKGGTDMAVSQRGARLYGAPRPESKAAHWHPSVDVLVTTALQHVPPKQLVGVMLTGMGNDGAQAMTRLKRDGGRTIAESADTAVVFGMPHELIALGGASLVLPSTGIAAQLRAWLPATAAANPVPSVPSYAATGAA